MAPGEWKTDHGYTIRREYVRMLGGGQYCFRIYPPGVKGRYSPEGYDTLAEAIARADDMARGAA